MPRIAILALPEATASVVYGMYDLFRSAGRDWGLIVHGVPGEPRLDPVVVSGTANKSDLTLANGVRIVPDVSLQARAQYSVICIPELAIAPDVPVAGRYRSEVAWLRKQYERGALVATACSGAVLAAEAGLLDGQDATTHWAYCEPLRKQYPSVKVHEDRALVVSGEGQLIMAGGGTSWLDLALYLIARLTDLDTAMQTARVNLIDWHSSGQQPFARLARTRQAEGDAVIGKCQEWIAKNYGVDAPVASMVRISGLPERTFKRRFQAATGSAPLAYVHMLRLEAAKERLERAEDSIERIARDVGYEDAAFFARLFRRAVRLTPAQYRRKFGSLRRHLSAGPQNGQRARG